MIWLLYWECHSESREAQVGTLRRGSVHASRGVRGVSGGGVALVGGVIAVLKLLISKTGAGLSVKRCLDV